MPQCSSGNNLVVLASSLAIAMSKYLSLNELNILGNFFNALGDNLSMIASQQEACGK
mgnify:FL=1|jgi:hypothetical protein